MAEKHSKKQILAHLSRQSIGILGTIDPSGSYVRQRVMYYGLDEQFQCYMMSTRQSPKINQILSTKTISFIVFGLEDPYDNSWETELNGHALLLQDKKGIATALNLLKDRNPFADVAIESGITGQFDIIQLIPSVIRFRVYGEALKGEDSTVIKL